MMTPEELKSARHALGLSAEGFARWVNVASGRTVRKWEAGDRDIPGPVSVLVKATMENRSVRAHFGLALQDDSALES
jgi:DNA-binding transcriptional regulator YiaG